MQGRKKLELLEIGGQVYISFGYNEEDELLEIELDNEDRSDEHG